VVATDSIVSKSGSFSPGQLWQSALWASVLFCLLTLDDHAEFVLFELARPDHVLLVAAFLVSSVGLVEGRCRKPPVLLLHLGVVAVFLLSHPFAPVFERDGTMALLGVYVATVLFRSSYLRAETRLLAGSALVGLFVLEFGVAVMTPNSAPAWTRLPDYGDLLGEMKSGGMLEPNLDLDVVGEAGPARFITNQSGFRNRQPAVRRKVGDEYRVLLLGDSFVAGYRMDQDATVGHLLGIELWQPLLLR